MASYYFSEALVEFGNYGQVLLHNLYNQVNEGDKYFSSGVIWLNAGQDMIKVIFPGGLISFRF